VQRWPDQPDRVQVQDVHTALDVRRFTAPDMFGAAGTLRRRKIIRAEFVVGCPLLVLIGAASLLAGHLLTGAWILGVAVKYLAVNDWASCG